jgi:hypothetical protein
MPDVTRTIEKVELVVQCLGHPEAWFSHTTLGGFPGIVLPEPDVLQFCRAGLHGKTITVPDVGDEPTDEQRQAFTKACREQIAGLFDEAVGKEGPGGEGWALGSEAWATIRDHIIWVWGTEAIAIALATRPLDADGELLPEEGVQPFVRTYDFPTTDAVNSTRIIARFNLLFHLVK